MGTTVSRLRRVTLVLRAQLPPWLVRILKTGLVRWGMFTGRWRMTPAFLVIGAQRAGTTTLFRLLSEHPSVVRPTIAKGIGYFDDDYHRGPRWYRAHFPLRALRNRDKLAFESSGYYLFHPLAAERIARDLPRVRAVVMVRDPVVRAHSAHHHEYARGFETEPFERALELEESRLSGEAERLRSDPRARSFHHRHHGYLARSRYGEQIQRYVDLLGIDRVYIVDADRFFASPVEEFRALQEWLGLRPHIPEKVERWNARSRASMSPTLRADLVRFFEPSDQDLARLMGRPPSWREEAIRMAEG